MYDGGCEDVEGDVKGDGEGAMDAWNPDPETAEGNSWQQKMR